MSNGPLHALSRINVRVVSMLCALIAILACGAVGWRLSRWEVRYPNATAPLRYSPPPSGEWNGGDNPTSLWADNSPFSSAYLDSQLAQRDRIRGVAEAARAAAATSQPPLGESSTSTRPRKPPPRQRKRSLVYRGVFTRTDGTSVAMVEDVETKRTVILKLGDRTEGLMLKQLDRSGASLLAPDGVREHRLPVGQRVQIIVDDTEGAP